MSNRRKRSPRSCKPTPPRFPRKSSLPIWVAASVTLLLLAILFAFPRTQYATQRLLLKQPREVTTDLPIHSLAVLPLENISNDPTQDYFADGMTDQLITALGKIKSVRVISRTSVMGFKGSSKPIAEIARDLNVDVVVEGTVFKSGSQVRITAQLIQARQDRHLWAESYEGNLHDVLSLQNSIAGAIAQAIRVTITPEEQASLKSVHPVNPEAFEDYLQGRYFWNKRDGRAFGNGDGGLPKGHYDRPYLCPGICRFSTDIRADGRQHRPER